MQHTLSHAETRTAGTLLPITRRDLDTWEIVSLFRHLDPADRAHVLRVSERLAAWHGTGSDRAAPVQPTDR